MALARGIKLLHGTYSALSGYCCIECRVKTQTPAAITTLAYSFYHVRSYRYQNDSHDALGGGEGSGNGVKQEVIRRTCSARVLRTDARALLSLR